MSRPAIGLDCGLQVRSRHGRDYERLEVPRHYTDAVELAGGIPVLLPVIDDPGLVDQQLDLVDGLLLIGADDLAPRLYGEPVHPETRPMHPDRQVYDLELARAAIRRDVPVLGVCGGLQLVNVCCGGKLIQHLPDEVGDDAPHRADDGGFTEHEVFIEPHSRLHRILGRERLVVNSGHHQAAKTLGVKLRVTARSPDGVVEALEMTGDAFCVCVQWHPEQLARDHADHLALFEALVEASRQDADVA
ncbi:MAG: gamma-glutamyl-gamma-aminobutyrate hydrolase family protein [Planctomycetota bacterium]